MSTFVIIATLALIAPVAPVDEAVVSEKTAPAPFALAVTAPATVSIPVSGSRTVVVTHNGSSSTTISWSITPTGLFSVEDGDDDDEYIIRSIAGVANATIKWEAEDGAHSASANTAVSAY